MTRWHVETSEGQSHRVRFEDAWTEVCTGCGYRRVHPRPTADGPAGVALDEQAAVRAERVLVDVERLTREQAERIAAALAAAEATPGFEGAKVDILMSLRVDCAANVEVDMNMMVARVGAVFDPPPTDEPWRSAWQAAFLAACALIGWDWCRSVGCFREPFERLIGPWAAAWPPEAIAPGLM